MPIASAAFPRLFASLATGLALAAAAAPAVARAPVTAALVQDYEPAPAIWQLADEDTTIYLFGTIHLLPEGFRWRSAQFDEIVARVDALVLESSTQDAERSLAAIAGKLDRLVKAAQSISARLSPSARPKWQAMIEASGQAFEVMDRMPLAMVMMGLGTTTSDEGLASYEHGVETVLEREFARTGRPVLSLESHGNVLLSLLRLDEGVLLRALEAELALMPPPGRGRVAAMRATMPEDWSMEHAWARGEVVDDFDLGLGSGKAGHAFHRVLLARRNAAWAQWLERRMAEPGSILVAVGAGHFEGRHSLLAMLAARGLAPTRIN